MSEVIFGSNLQHFSSNALSLFILGQPDSFLWEQQCRQLSPYAVWVPSFRSSKDLTALPEKKQNSVLYTHKKKEDLRVLLGIRIYIYIILHRKIQQRNLRIVQNLGHWGPTFPLGSMYHSPLVSSLTAKEPGPLGYQLLQTEVNVLYLLFKSPCFCTGDMGLTKHFLVIIFPGILWGRIFSFQ